MVSTLSYGRIAMCYRGLRNEARHSIYRHRFRPFRSGRTLPGVQLEQQADSILPLASNAGPI